VRSSKGYRTEKKEKRKKKKEDERKEKNLTRVKTAGGIGLVSISSQYYLCD
jgi:hypothetical protein